MRIAIGSAFRDAEHNAVQYVQRIVSLRDLLGPQHTVRLIAGEGDSVDRTRTMLSAVARSAGLPLDFADCAHGGPRYGSTEAPERMKALSFVLNRIMDVVRADDDVFVYVEQDLHWEAQVLRALIARAYAKLDHLDIFAPMVMAGRLFYDVWGFRALNGERWYGVHPYHKDVDHDAPTCEVSSIGSCCAMSSVVAMVSRVRDGNAFVGWCADARANGFRIAACPDLAVRQA